MSVQVVLDMRELQDFVRNIPDGEVVRILHDGVEYGVYQEFGTRYIGARPFMTPAVEAVRPALEQGFKQVQNLKQAETLVEKLARDAEGHAKARAPVRTGALRNSIEVSRAEDF